MIALYRARAPEVRALDLGDGRHVILDTPPRYMPTAEFEAMYEPVSDRRQADRPALAGVPADDTTPGAERMQAMIAARTEPTNGHPPRRPRGKAEVDRVLDEARTQVDREIAARSKQDGGNATGTKLAEGQKPGRGRKACPKCHILNGVRAAECGSCGAKFPKPK